MNNKEPKYPASLFWIGVLQNIVKNFMIIVLAIVFFVLGVWLKWCFIAGGVALVLAIIVAIVEQIQIRNAILNSNNPELKEWQDAMLSKNWRENIKNIVESKMNDPKNRVDYDDIDENDDEE